MKTAEEIINKHVHKWSEICEQEVIWAINEARKESATEFLKWYGIKMVGFIEYITKIKPVVESNEIEQKIIEFEGKPIENLYEIFLKENQNK